MVFPNHLIPFHFIILDFMQYRKMKILGSDPPIWAAVIDSYRIRSSETGVVDNRGSVQGGATPVGDVQKAGEASQVRGPQHDSVWEPHRETRREKLAISALCGNLCRC